nr:nicotinamide-nucleotide amidohydrolase family protein [Bacillus subtilis]
MLGVKKETLDRFGAVSKECASELAKGVQKLTGSDIGISFTGVAGPDAQEGHEPGMCLSAFPQTVKKRFTSFTLRAPERGSENAALNTAAI